MSVLHHALLGLLAREPRTGYQLSKVMVRQVAYFWSANHSQIYPALHRLETAGQISSTAYDGPGPRDTKVFTITAAGRDALRAWLVRPTEIGADRDEFVVRVFSLWLLDRTDAVHLVEEHRALHAARLATYRSIRSELGEPADPGDPQFAQRATLEAGLSYQQHRISWCDWLLERLRAQE